MLRLKIAFLVHPSNLNFAWNSGAVHSGSPLDFAHSVHPHHCYATEPQACSKSGPTGNTV